MPTDEGKPNAPIATLSMYDWPEIQPEMDALWNGIAGQLANCGMCAPQRLNRSVNPETMWHRPNLLVGQTCGWPYATRLRGQVVPFARFHYAVDVVPPGHYTSVFIANDPASERLLAGSDTLADATKIAINSEDSQSGFQVFGEITAKPAEKSISEAQRLITGAHRASIRAVAKGEAQLAAIDAVAFELARVHEPESVEKVCVVGHSKPKPGLPLITSKNNCELADLLFQAISKAIEDLEPRILDTLLISGLVPASDDDYADFAGHH